MTGVKPLFIYGQLLDHHLLHAVIGRDGGDLRFIPAQLPGYRVSRVPGTALPAVVRSRHDRATGEIVIGLTPTDMERLDYFELSFGWQRRASRVQPDGSGPSELREVTIYFPPSPSTGGPENWDPGLWIESDQDVTVETAAEFMDLFGKVAPEDAGRLFDPMRARAVARLNALNPRFAPPAPLGGLDAGDVDTRSVTRPYTDYFTLEEHHLSFTRFDGSPSDVVKRAVFVTGDAVTVLPYDPNLDAVLLIEQFRAGPMGRRDPSPWLLEPVAGRVETANGVEDAAHRECMEEAGITLRALEKVSYYYPSPGTFSEYLYSFVGIADLSQAGGVHGLESEHEDIKVHVLPFDAAYRMIEDGHARNAPLILSLQWLAMHRDRLQGRYRRG